MAAATAMQPTTKIRRQIAVIEATGLLLRLPSWSSGDLSDSSTFPIALYGFKKFSFKVLNLMK